MPEISDEGRTWTMRVKPGIYFADDPTFKGKKRELVAADYVYSWKRLIDPKVRSPFAWYLQDKIVGADAVIDAAKKSGRRCQDQLGSRTSRYALARDDGRVVFCAAFQPGTVA